MVGRRTRNRVNNANLTRSQAALKTAINNSLTAYMKNAASPANLANVNKATRNLIKVYVENVAAANVKPPNVNGGNKPPGNGNGGNKPLALTNGNKPLALPAPGNANTSPLNAGTNLFNGGTKSQNMKVNFSTKLGMMTSPNEKTYLSLNAMKKSVTANPNLGNKRNVMLRQIANKKAELNKKSANILTNFQGRINAAKNGSELNTIVKNISARRSNLSGRNSNALLTKLREKRGQFANAANAKATANKAAANAAKAANAAAKNAAEANAVAKKITASAIASAIEKQKAVNNQAAANKAAQNAARAANAAKAAAAAASGRNKLRVAAAAARSASLLKLAGNAGASRRNALLKAANTSIFNGFVSEITGAYGATDPLYKIRGRVNASSNLNNTQKGNLRQKISNARLGTFKRNVAKATTISDINGRIAKHLQTASRTYKILTNNHKAEAAAYLKNKRESLKVPGRS